MGGFKDRIGSAPLTEPLHTTPGDKPSLFEMARTFLMIGTFAFGGQSGLLALLNRDLVERHGWLVETDITEAFTYVQLLPGAVVVQVVAYLGWKLHGARGVAVATVAFLLPSLLTMLALGMIYRRVATLAGVRAALGGLTAAVVGLIALATFKQGRKTITESLALVVAVIVFAASLFWHLNPALLVVMAGLLSIVREVFHKTRIAKKEAGGR